MTDKETGWVKKYLIGATVTVSIVLAGHSGALIWWCSKTEVRVTHIEAHVAALETDFDIHVADAGGEPGILSKGK